MNGTTLGTTLSMVVLLGLLMSTGTSVFSQDLIVDYSNPIGPAEHRACGFLHGIEVNKPDDALLAPLKIRFIRGKPKSLRIGDLPGLDEVMAKRAEVLNYPDSLRLSLGVYYYDKKLGYPGDNGDWKTWEDIVDDVVNEVRQKKMKCYWVIWNEPDYEKFWPRSAERHRETWRRAYRRIKAIDSEAIITGPTTMKYSFKDLTNFLTYCKKNDCVPDFVTWHELTSTAENVESNVNQIREWCEQNEVKISGVIVDEYGGRRVQYLPGMAVGFISALEKAKVTYAARAIWTDAGTLCGATTTDGKSPTSVWWVYKAYSDATGEVYDVAEPKGIMALAVADKQDSAATILIGNQSKEKRKVNLVVRNLSKVGLGTDSAVVYLRHIPNSGSDALKEPKPLPATYRKTGKDTLTIEVGSLAGYEAIEILFSESSLETQSRKVADDASEKQ